MRVLLTASVQGGEHEWKEEEEGRRENRWKEGKRGRRREGGKKRWKEGKGGGRREGWGKEGKGEKMREIEEKKREMEEVGIGEGADEAT